MKTNQRKKVGIAFQGAGFAGGSVAAGVMKRLVERGAFEKYDVRVFSGTSSGALVAAVCWGHLLEDRMEEAPGVLHDQWMHFALNLVPNASWAEVLELYDSVAQLNPLYQYWSEAVRVPCFRELFQSWVREFIPLDRYRDAFDARRGRHEDPPRIVIGTANLLTGQPKFFTEQDLSLKALLASGSLDDVIGVTEIHHVGSFIDGAWASNPPLRKLIDPKYGIEELWLVQVFPQTRKTVPRRPAQMKSRRDQLWQDALVQQELSFVNKVNDWIRRRIITDPGYRIVNIKTMEMKRDLSSGDIYVNNPDFIRQMMDYGYRHADVFFDGYWKGSSNTVNEAARGQPSYA